MPYRRGRKWVAQVRTFGIRREKIFQTRAEALGWEAEQRKLPAESLKSETSTSCLHDWAGAYLDFAKTRFSHKTYDEKKTVFRRFFQVIDPTQHIEKLTSGQVLSYLQVQAQQRSGYAANKDRKNLLAAWNWGIKYLGFPASNPCLVDRFPEKRQTRYIPPERDFWAVYDVADGQDELMLLAYLHLAARRSELFRLRWDDVDFANASVRLGTRKRMDGSLEYDWLPMTDELFNALVVHRQTSQSQWVFPNPETGENYEFRRHWMKRLCKRAGVMAFGIHAIRHLTASLLAQEGVPMVQIQAILRHKNLSTTDRYLHRLSDLRPALQVLSRKK
ncbi:MAG: site-specific integrase, partial [Deltaproteobacteria bacterium]|nr:site-specific integrase [Deltaproteobacteria bacterium]